MRKDLREISCDTSFLALVELYLRRSVQVSDHYLAFSRMDTNRQQYSPLTIDNSAPDLSHHTSISLDAFLVYLCGAKSNHEKDPYNFTRSYSCCHCDIDQPDAKKRG